LPLLKFQPSYKHYWRWDLISYTIFSQFLSFLFIQNFNVDKRRNVSCIKLLANVSEGYGAVKFCAGYRVIFSSHIIFGMLENTMIDLIIIELVFTQTYILRGWQNFKANWPAYVLFTLQLKAHWKYFQVVKAYSC